MLALLPCGFNEVDGTCILVLPRLSVPIPVHLRTAMIDTLEKYVLGRYCELGLTEPLPYPSGVEAVPVDFRFAAPQGWFADNQRSSERGQTKGIVFDVRNTYGVKLFEVSQIMAPLPFAGRVRFAEDC